MKDNWILKSKMQIPYGAEGYCFLYTPDHPSSLCYRIVPFSGAKKITSATHWQPCLPPSEKIKQLEELVELCGLPLGERLERMGIKKVNKDGYTQSEIDHTENH